MTPVLSPAHRLTLGHTLQAAYALLPSAMQTPEATQMLLAIGWQESRFAARRQAGNGPARGFWQFEKGGGVEGVLRHESSALLCKGALQMLRYPLPISSTDCHLAITHNDVLACIFARLLLYTLPNPLPSLQDVPGGWSQYMSAWRPGKPHPETWPHAWAWATVVRQAIVL